MFWEKRGTVRGFVLLVTLLGICGTGMAEVSLIFNGSFENDGWSEDQYITVQAPERWEDVNVVGSQFGGYIGDEWSPDGVYSLTLYAKIYSPFDVNDMVTVTQDDVYLADVNHIMFYLQLSTSNSSVEWDPELFSAVVLIDGDVVWDSDGLTIGGDNEYAVDIDETSFTSYRDGLRHTLGVGIRSNSMQEWIYYYYKARWDFLRLDTHADCDGFDYPGGDFNMDCISDWDDLAMLAEKWLSDDPRYDIFADGIVNFRDFVVFGNTWLGNRDETQKLLERDLNDDGIVDFRDFAIFAENWKAGVYEDVYEMADEWLWTSWLYGL